MPAYRESRLNLVFDEDVLPDTDFLALNTGEGYGFLRVMDLEDRPNPLDETSIASLLDGYVHYEVTENGWTLRAATRAEVDDHYASSRPALEQTPQRDLSVTTITPLSEIGFEDWTAFGVKAANVAVLGTLGFPAGTVPDGFAIPFYFYDEFMKANGFDDDIEEMLADTDFQSDFETQDDMLDDLRDDIKDAETPEWIIAALTEMNEGFPEGINRRYRSSTNNEDLPGFNGAGLYGSKSQRPDEDEEDLAKSLKEVYASLWNFRAFIERDFHRIDHTAAAMGVLVHPSYQDELANGVAVSFDPVSGGEGSYYVNTQVGEDLVTNPDALSVPEEILLRPLGRLVVLGTSNQLPPGELIMSGAQMAQLGGSLTVIDDHFAGLYNPAPGEPFDMEIEFKITSENILAIKQARPWVFSTGVGAVGADTGEGGGAGGSGGGGSSGGGGGGSGGGGGGGGGGGPRQTVPDAPTHLIAEAADAAVTLTWDAPEDDGGSAITDYEYRIDGKGRWISIGSTDTTHTVTGLDNDTIYTFQVRAVNRIGRSQPSSDPVEATPRMPVALDFTHFTNGGLITSDLVLVNAGAAPIRPVLYFYDPEGHLMDPEAVVDITGDLMVTEDGSLTVQTEMEPLGELTISTHGRGEMVSGSVKVVADGPIGGGLRFDIPDLGVAGVGASSPVQDALFPARRQAGGIRTAAAIHNLGAEAMGVNCQLMSGGVALEEVAIPLEANGQTAWFIEDAFTATDTSDFTGSVRCTAPGEGRFTAIAAEMDAARGIFTTLPVVEVNRGRAEATTLDFAHFANGTWITDLVFVNLETRQSGPPLTPFHTAILPSRPAIYFYDTEGNPIAPASVVDLTGDLMVTEDGALTVHTDMEPLGVLTISTHGRGDLVSGSVKVVSSEGPIGGMAAPRDARRSK